MVMGYYRKQMKEITPRGLVDDTITFDFAERGLVDRESGGGSKRKLDIK